MLIQPLFSPALPARLPEHLRHSVQSQGLFGPGDRVLVAVSGGPDSVALLHLLDRSKAEEGLSLGVAHFDHGLRGEASEADAAFVAELAGSLNLPLHQGKGDVRGAARARKISFQMAARELRRKFFEETRRRGGYNLVALGHTADDQVELFFLRLLRGTGPEGLKGMWPRTADGLVRPLLSVGKEVILGWLAQEGLAFRTDMSNLGRQYLRNRVRLDLVPGLIREYNPRLRAAIWRLMALLQEDEAILSAEAAATWERLGRRLGPDLAVLPIPPFLELPPGLQKRVLGLALAPLLAGRDLTSAQVAGLLGLARSGRSGGSFTWGDCRVARAGKEIHLSRALPAPASGWRAALTQPGVAVAGGWRLEVREYMGSSLSPRPWPPRLAWLDRGKAPWPLTLRPWLPGDRFRPEGAPGERKIQDFWVDAKIPRWLRPHLPLLASREELVWIPGCRLAAGVSASPESRGLWEVEVTPADSYARQVWEHLRALIRLRAGAW